MSESDQDNEEQADCVICAKDVKDEEALQCDLCDYWFHIECYRMDREDYQKIQDIVELVQWFCRSCVSSFKGLKKQVTSLQKRVDELESSMETKINEKVSDILYERLEREKRKCNLVFFGMPEAGDDRQGKDRMKFDRNRVCQLGNNLCDELKTKEEDIETLFRVGERDPEKKRPLVVKFRNAKDKFRLLKNSKKLNQAKDGRSSVFIAPDLTKEQRTESQKVYTELKRRKDAGEENLVILRGRIVEKKMNREIDPWEEGAIAPEARAVSPEARVAPLKKLAEPQAVRKKTAYTRNTAGTRKTADTGKTADIRKTRKQGN